MLAIKILANECQEVNPHVHLPTVRTCKNCRLEKWQVFVWMQWCVATMSTKHLDSHQWRGDEVCL